MRWQWKVRSQRPGANTSPSQGTFLTPCRKEVNRMYIDVDTIIKAASLLGALGALVGAVIAVYKVYETDKKQSVIIKEIQEEQTLICYGLRGALQGLIEQGCDGPCKDALNMLDKHLNKSAHQTEL